MNYMNFLSGCDGCEAFCRQKRVDVSDRTQAHEQLAEEGNAIYSTKQQLVLG